MAQTSKGKPPAASTAAPGDEGKQSLNQSAPDFPRMVNMMAGSGFFQQWPGAMTFYNHPDNAFWSDRYSKSTFANGWATAKKKNLENLQRGPVQEDACEFLSVVVLSFGAVVVGLRRLLIDLDSSTHSDSFLLLIQPLAPIQTTCLLCRTILLVSSVLLELSVPASAIRLQSSESLICVRTSSFPSSSTRRRSNPATLLHASRAPP